MNKFFVKMSNFTKKDILEDVIFIVLMDFGNLEMIASLGMNTNILNLQPEMILTLMRRIELLRKNYLKLMRNMKIYKFNLIN